MLKKKYAKPNIENKNSKALGILPPLAAVAALVGAYAIGRSVSKAFDVRGEYFSNKSLRKVINRYE
ncbi:MAG: hypothetical protein ACRC0G_13460 [Fusobacteriaceae bacterium]